MRDRRAFTLIELLMVLLIIGIVIAIVIPALGGARNAARAAATQRVLTNFVTAANAFSNDRQGVPPGFYSALEMGSQENIAYGLTAMENAMLDLAGGLVSKPGIGGGGSVAADVVEVEIPGTDRIAYVNPDLIGSGDYFTPDKAYYVPQPSPSQVGNGDHIGESETDRQIPDLVDAWGNPILLWVEDPAAPSRIEEVEDFARVSSGTGGGQADQASHFYWASNAGFLKSTQLGKSRKDQTMLSLLRESLGQDVVRESLMGVLGNPSFPDNRALDADEILASASRSAFVTHSAGADGVYFSQRDRGAKAIGAAAGESILYGLNFKTERTGNVDLETDNGQVDTRDVVQLFDDMVQAGGN